MKKTLFAIAALALVATACGQKNKKTATDTPESKVLVAYFSATGTTETVAKQLAEVTSATLYEIKPEVKYTAEDLDWRNQESRSSLEMKDKSSRPAITGKMNDIKKYDVIYVGFPIWWYTAPTIINTFLEKYDWTGKTIVLFATSGGSGFGKAAEGLKGSVAADTVIIEGRVFRGRASDEDLRKISELA